MIGGKMMTTKETPAPVPVTFDKHLEESDVGAVGEEAVLLYQGSKSVCCP